MSESPTANIDSIEVSVGAATHPEGAALVSVLGDGRVSISTTHLQERKVYNGRIKAGVAERLIKEADLLLATFRASKRTGIPDEARYSFMVDHAGRGRTLEAWESELEAYPPTKKLLGELRDLTIRISEGQAFL